MSSLLLLRIHQGVHVTGLCWVVVCLLDKGDHLYDLNSVCLCTSNVWQCMYERKREMCDAVVVRLSRHFPMNTDELRCVRV